MFASYAIKQNYCSYNVFMYENGTMRLVETILRMGEED
jgi:hypothetical protein